MDLCFERMKVLCRAKDVGWKGVPREVVEIANEFVRFLNLI